MSTRGKGDDERPPGWLTVGDIPLASLAPGLPVLLALVDTDGVVRDMGGQLMDVIGLYREEFVGHPVSEIMGGGQTAPVVGSALAGRPAAVTVTFDKLPWELFAGPVRDERGTVIGASVMARPADALGAFRALDAASALNVQLSAVLDFSQDFVSMSGLDQRVTYLNQAGRELVGLGTDEQTLGRPIADFLPDSSKHQRNEIYAGLETNGHWQGESWLRHFDGGEAIPVSVDTFMVKHPTSGAPLALATVQRDLRPRLRAEGDLAVRVQEQRVLAELGRLALTEPPMALMAHAAQLVGDRFTQMDAGIFRASPGGGPATLVASSQTGWSPLVIPLDTEGLGGSALVTNTSLSSSDLLTDERFSDAVATDFGRRAVVTSPIPGDGPPWGFLGVSGVDPHPWTDDDLAFLELVTATLGAAVRREELERQLAHQALHDPLTGLPNRALVDDRIGSALRRGSTDRGRLAVLLLDVDDFKIVNDFLGHGQGDTLLAALAARLQEVVSESTTVGRFGGDEFVVVCEDLDSDARAVAVAEQILRACSRDVTLGSRTVNVSASIGIAFGVAGEITSAKLLSEADIAMHRAKRERRGSYRVFHEGMRGAVVDRADTATELRAAVRQGLITVAYQPIVDLATGRVVAMEALARWTNSRGEAVPPDLFIRLAEEMGIIGELGAQVLRTATLDAVAWQPEGQVSLRVNVTAAELRSSTYVGEVLTLLDAGGLATRLLGLEITESMFIEHDTTTVQNLVRLSEAGVSLLIDDFGTGYSSLSYLQRFPIIDILKVDRSFLTDGESARGGAVIRAVVGMGRAFGWQVCAEGVETAEQHALVTELGCDLAQGYLFSRPMTAEDAREALQTWRPCSPSDHGQVRRRVDNRSGRPQGPGKELVISRWGGEVDLGRHT